MERKLTPSRNHSRKHEAVTSRHIGVTEGKSCGTFGIFMQIDPIPYGGLRTFVGINPTTLGLILQFRGMGKVIHILE